MKKKVWAWYIENKNVLKYDEILAHQMIMIEIVTCRSYVDEINPFNFALLCHFIQ